MKVIKLIALTLAMLAAAAAGPGVASADDDGNPSARYTLEFIATQNAPGGVTGDAVGHMAIRIVNGQTRLHFRVRGLYPDTVYTIWTVFNKLTWTPENPGNPPKVGSCSANGPDKDCPGWTGQPGFLVEGNGVAPTAATSSGFSSGIRLDPGATFTTNGNGDGEVQVKLDYNLLGGDADGPPLGNFDIIRQCAPEPAIGLDAKSGKPICPVGSMSLRITTTYLRKFVGHIKTPAERAAQCANYDPQLDPSNLNGSVGSIAPFFDAAAAHDADARQWQCVNPTTGLVQVHRYQFDHFRVANHPDGLTHGFIGGNGVDHWIDMVGRRCNVVPSVGATCP